METKSNILDNVSPVQKEAIEHNSSSLLLLAGAGSGKTLVITKKIAYLIKEMEVPLENILAVTFTNKAANEMKARTKLMMKDVNHYALWIRTFHSTALNILKSHANHLGYRKDFTIIDEQDKLGLLKNVIKVRDIDIPKDLKLKQALKYISKAKNSLEDIETYLKETYVDGEIYARLYNIYMECALSENVMDFDDLLLNTIRLFENRIDVLNYYRNKWQYILVDEFQDTNQVQYKIIRMLTENNDNKLTVVGDDDQSIYAFRGATVSNILNFKTDYPDTLTVKLEENYRCPKDVVKAALHVIKHNKNRHEKNVFSNKKGRGKIQKCIFNSDLDEAKYIINEIEKLFDLGFNANEIVILFRTNSQSRVYEKELRTHNIEYKIVGGIAFFERAEIKDSIAFLRLMFGLKDNISLRRVINKPARSVGDKSLMLLEKLSIDENTTIYDAIDNIDKTSIGKKAKTSIIDFKNKIEQYKQVIASDESEIEKVFKGFLSEIDYFNIYAGEDDFRLIAAEDNIKELFRAFYEYKAYEGNVSFIDFLGDLALTRHIENDEEDVITLMTVHNAKGLEFDVVFLTGLEMGVFPHYYSLEEENGIEEERRLCYVGITRAKEMLYLTHSMKRRSAIGIEYNEPSIFLKDIPDSIVETKYIETQNRGYIEIDDDAFDY